MGLFRNEGVGILTTVAVCACLLLAAIPAGMYAGRQLSNPNAETEDRVDESVWLAATTLTVQDSAGGRRLLATAMKMRNPEDAERICQYLPVIRDRLVQLAAQGEIAVTPTSVAIGAEALRTLTGDLESMLGRHGPKEVFLYDSSHPDRLPTNMNRPKRCEGDRLTGF